MAAERYGGSLVPLTQTPSIPASDLLNRQPGPRVLVWGFDEDEALVRAVSALAPTVQHLEGDAYLPYEAILEEWDFVVMDRPLAVPHHLSFIYVAEPRDKTASVDSVREAGASQAIAIEQRSPARRSELHLPSNLTNEVSQLVEATLLRGAKANPAHLHFTTRASPPSSMTAMAVSIAGRNSADNVFEGLQPLLMDADRRVLACRYVRGAEAEALLLPSTCTNLERWISFMLAELHERSPVRYPLVGWATSDRWRTAPEREVAAALDAVRAERVKVLREFDTRIESLERHLTDEQDAAAQGRRLLLTGTGDVLVAEVAQTLEQLGFIVVSADDSKESGTPLLEDLRITDPSDPTWTAIGEVKGHTKGAQTSVFQRLARYAGHFTTGSGAPPAARWYIVNHHRHQDPQTRPVVLAGGDADIEEFAKDSGLVIDTAELFDAAETVAAGRRSAADLRDHLRAARGRFHLSSEA